MVIGMIAINNFTIIILNIVIFNIFINARNGHYLNLLFYYLNKGELFDLIVLKLYNLCDLFNLYDLFNI